MPNWCSCSLSLPGVPVAAARRTLADVFARYSEVNERSGNAMINFNKIHPCPPGLSDKVPGGQLFGESPAQGWIRNNWGTSAWGFYAKLRDGSDETTWPFPEPSLFVDCKWSPCDGIVRELSRQYPAVPWLVEWSEEQGPGPGGGFVGYALYRRGRELAHVMVDQWTDVSLCTSTRVVPRHGAPFRVTRSCDGCGAARRSRGTRPSPRGSPSGPWRPRPQNKVAISTNAAEAAGTQERTVHRQVLVRQPPP